MIRSAALDCAKAKGYATSLAGRPGVSDTGYV